MSVKLMLNPDEILWGEIKQFKKERGLETLHDAVIILLKIGLKQYRRIREV